MKGKLICSILGGLILITGLCRIFRSDSVARSEGANKTLNKARTRDLLEPVTLSSTAANAGIRQAQSTRQGASVPESKGTNFALYRSVEDAPKWTVPYGKEFWRRSTRPPHTATSRTNKSSTFVSSDIDLSDVIDRVSHAITESVSSEHPRVRAKTYTAAFDGTGLRFSPHRPATDDLPAGKASLMALADFREARSGDTRGFPQPDPDTEGVVRTLSIRHGDSTLYEMGSRDIEWSILGNTAQALLNDRAGLIEHYEARGSGVELSWVFRRKPDGDGPVEIRFEVSGVRYAGSSAQGDHFADSDGRSRIRVENTEVIDARGTRWSLPAGVREGVLTVSISTAILTRAEFPLSVDPLISSEFGTDEPVPVPSLADYPALASNGDEFLAVWNDYRVTGTRIANDGTILDPLGILVNAAPGGVPAVASDGQDFLVVWYVYREIGFDVFCKRVGRTGNILDPEARLVSSAAGDQTQPAVAGGPGGYLIVWQDTRNSTDVSYRADIYGCRITSEGSVIDTNGIPVATTDYQQWEPRIASNGRDFLVVWSETPPDIGGVRFLHDVKGTRVSAEGQVLDTNPITISAAAFEQQHPVAAGDGTNYFVVWQDARNATGEIPEGDIYGARVTASGTVLDTNGLPIRTTEGSQFSPSIATDGTNYLAVWVEYGPTNATGVYTTDIYGARVNSQGIVMDLSGIKVSGLGGSETRPQVTASRTCYLVTWRNSTPGASDPSTGLSGTRISYDGVVLDPASFWISWKANTHASPAVASNGTNYLVTWLDNRTERGPFPSDIFGARIDRAGHLLDPTAFKVNSGPFVESQPEAASNGSDYLVVWAERRSASQLDVCGARISSEGSLLDTNSIAICAAPADQGCARLTSDGRDYLVTWEDARNNSETNVFLANVDIYAARVTSAGAVLDQSGFPVSAFPFAEFAPAVAYNEQNYFIVWTDKRNGPSDGFATDVFGARVSLQGVVLDPQGIAVSTASNWQQLPSVAGSGGEYFVAWEDFRLSGSPDVFGARVSSDGTVVQSNGVPICTAPHGQGDCVVVGGVAGYLVTWFDTRDALDGGVSRIYGARVSPAGEVIEPNGVPLTEAHSSRFEPTIARLGADFLLAHAGPNSNGVERVHANLLTFVSSPLLVSSYDPSSRVFRLRLSGEAGFNYSVAYTTNFTSWLTLTTVTNLTNSIEFADPNSSVVPARFFRAEVLRP